MKFSTLLVASCGLSIALLPESALAVFICKSASGTSYQQTPCPRPATVSAKAAVSAEETKTESASPDAEAAQQKASEQDVIAPALPVQSDDAVQQTNAAAVAPASPVQKASVKGISVKEAPLKPVVDLTGLIPLQAIRDNDLLQVATALAAGAAIDAVYPPGTGIPATPLAASLHFTARDVFELLLRRGANVSVAQSSSWTPIIQAAASGEVNTLEKLIRHGAGEDTATLTKALTVAAQGGHRDAMTFLLSHGAQLQLSKAQQ